MNPFLAKVQALLAEGGYTPGPADGLWGPRTKGALTALIFNSGRPQNPASPQKPTMLLPRHLPWVAEGLKVYGLHEVKDKAKLAAWLRSDGKTLGDPEALPWCGDAMETMVKNALPDEPFPAALGENPYWARNWLFFGKSISPTAGCIGVFDRAGGGGHVGVIVGQDSLHYYVLGGNQGDRMSIVRIDKGRLLKGGARWPIMFEQPARIALPQMKATDIPLSVNEA